MRNELNATRIDCEDDEGGSKNGLNATTTREFEEYTERDDDEGV